MKTVPLTTVLVTRDAMTKLPTDVPAHEIDILKLIFGEDNVFVQKEDVATVDLDEANEGDRLASKYGQEAVVAAFGANYRGAVSRALSSVEAAKPKGKAAASV